MSWLKNVAKGLAYAGKGAMATALYIDAHPEVVTIVASVAGHPDVAAKVIKGADAVTDVGKTVAEIKGDTTH